MKKYIPTLENLELIKELFKQNEPAYKVAEQLKITQNLLYRVCKEYNIVNPKSAMEITNEVIELVKNLFNKNFPLRQIAKEMNCDHKTIKRICKKIGLSFSERGLKGGQRPLAIPIPKEKFCPINDGKGCGLIKSFDKFRMVTATRKSGNSYTNLSPYCLDCESKISSENSKKHYRDNKKYYIGKRWKARIRVKEREAEDPAYKLRNRLSKAIGNQLKVNNGSKNGRSILKYLPYTMNELRKYLESQWVGDKAWMNWDNHGVYKLGGERKWHIDHIIPQSLLPFDSMDHPNFLKCWSLDNLQPLDAVENMEKHNKLKNINVTKYNNLLI